MVRVHLYSKEDCHLCDVAITTIERVQAKHPFEFVITKLTEQSPRYKDFSEKVPVVFVEGEQTFLYRVNEKQLLEKIKYFEAEH
ncbi:MAG: glutaredoxin family protein [Ignavibacteriales bacterium]|nr:glutaredoxin family protein [Ignavibacteriales bacterium]